MRRIVLAVVALALGAWFFESLIKVSAASKGPSFVEFESGHVRPIAMSADGTTLFAVNTPNGTLEIFDLTSGKLVLKYRVPVGLEPVAVAARNSTEVWVTNHLSDSVSVVSLAGTPHVIRTLLVGDEPRDIVFAGTPARAFVTTAHRGQQRTDPSIASVPGAGDPQMTTPGIGRADVWVFDPANPGINIGGMPLSILTFFTDTPRALAVAPDGHTVYVAGFKTGNQTTTVSQGRICTGFHPTKPCTLADGSTSPGGNPGPATDAAGEPAPEVGLIVKFVSGHWVDELNRVWDNSVRFTLPDNDVFSFDANTLKQTAAFAHVGTTLFSMAANPVNGHIYVSNTDAINNVRFEGPGTFAGHTVQGHLAEARITVISGSTVAPHHLNKHIDYTKLAGSAGFDATAKNHSLSMPLQMAVTSDGATLYVAAFGSSKIGVFKTSALEADTFNPVTDSANYISVSDGGPSGIVLDEARGVLYVTTRFDDAVKTIDLRTNREVSRFEMPNPEPAAIVRGRPMLYDATQFSGNGEAACASCHIFGDMDDLAWDLGNPDSAVTKSTIPINFGNLITLLIGFGAPTGVSTPINGSNSLADFHPMKGPFTTQTLRGMQNSGAMHWRGDRSTGIYGTDAFSSNTSFLNFGGAFQTLIGSLDQPSQAEMQMFADFQLHVLPPPNPVRSLDNSLNTTQNAGHAFFAGTRPSDGVNNALLNTVVGQASFSCNGCHVLDESNGFFGTGGNQSFEGLPQIVKIPHLRNIYAKVGMFGNPSVSFFQQADTGSLGDQVRGFGFTGDGSTDTIFRFLTAAVFNPTANSGFPQSNPDGARQEMEQYLFAFESDLAPIVGQQVTLTSTNAAAVGARISLLINRASTPFVSKALNGSVTECDLVVQVVQNGRVMGFLYDPVAANFVPDDGSAPLSDDAIRALAATPGQEVTYTAATPGSGSRIAFARWAPRGPIERRR